MQLTDGLRVLDEQPGRPEGVVEVGAAAFQFGGKRAVQDDGRLYGKESV